jgi:chromate transport protein ChrA
MESEDKHSVRLTTIAGSEAVSENDMYKGIFMISLQSFGNQHMQIENFSEKVVRDYKWATTSQINEIKNLCWALPGPTLYQMIITLTTLKLQSMKAGFMAFIIFNIPSWTLLFILGTLVSIYASDYEVTQVKLAFLGFNAAAAGVMMRNLIDYVK